MAQKQYYWYVKSYCDGKPVVLGAYATPDEADRAGVGLGEQYELVELPTRNLSAAVRMLRVHSLNNGETLQAAIQPTSHKVKKQAPRRTARGLRRFFKR